MRGFVGLEMHQTVEYGQSFARAALGQLEETDEGQRAGVVRMGGEDTAAIRFGERGIACIDRCICGLHQGVAVRGREGHAWARLL